MVTNKERILDIYIKIKFNVVLVEHKIWVYGNYSNFKLILKQQDYGLMNL